MSYTILTFRSGAHVATENHETRDAGETAYCDVVERARRKAERHGIAYRVEIHHEGVVLECADALPNRSESKSRA